MVASSRYKTKFKNISWIILFYPSVHHDEDGQGVSPEQEGGEGRGPGQAGPQLAVGHPQREEVQRGLLPRQPPVRDMQALLRTYLEGWRETQTKHS